MGYKKVDNNIGFADLTLAKSFKHNRSLKTMKNLSDAINWDRVEKILLSHYVVGKSVEGADAYSPLLLYKCLLIQNGLKFNPIRNSKLRSTT